MHVVDSRSADAAGTDMDGVHTCLIPTIIFQIEKHLFQTTLPVFVNDILLALIDNSVDWPCIIKVGTR